jgi:hypothetical protein
MKVIDMVLFLIRLSKIVVSICYMLILSLISLSCSGYDYTTQHFSYPPGSKPHDNNWQYTALVIVSSHKSPISKKSRKYVKFMVYDKNKKNFLTDEYEFNSASITAHVVWVTFDELNIELFEVGNEFADDDYNKILIERGPNILLKILYKYDQKDKKYTVEKKLLSQ